MKITKRQLRRIIREEVNEAPDDQEQQRSWMQGGEVTEDIPTTLPEMVAALDAATGALVAGKGDGASMYQAHKLINRVASALRLHPAYDVEE